MRRKNTAPLFLRLDGNKRLFTLMVVTIIVITIDSEIGYVADFIPEQISSRGGVFAFIVIAAIFAITQYFILDYVKQSNKETRERVSKLLTLHTGISVVQYILAAVIALVILQILLTQQVQYHIPLYRSCH